MREAEQTTVLIKDFMVNMFYGMKLTACPHLLTQGDIDTIINTSSKTSVLNSHEHRCLHCLHPVNCFMPDYRLLAASTSQEDDLFEVKDEYVVFDNWIQQEFMTEKDDSQSITDTKASLNQSFVESKDMKSILNSVESIIRDTSIRLLNTVQIGREKLDLRQEQTINGIFHAVLSQHIATAHINDACTNAAALWRFFADAHIDPSTSGLESMRKACRKTLRIAATYGWSIFTYSHLVCHVVLVELASLLSSRTTTCATPWSRPSRDCTTKKRSRLRTQTLLHLEESTR